MSTKVIPTNDAEFDKQPDASESKTPGKKKKTRLRRFGDVVLTNEATIEVVLKYQFGQPELKKLKHMFNYIDNDQSGTIDFDEFFFHMDEPRTNFTDGVFLLTELKKEDAMDFEEFVIVIATYCMFTRAEVLKFAYDSFDVDGSGSIDEEEFKRLCSCVNDGKPTFPGNFSRAINEFDRNGDGLIDFDEFQQLNKRYPLILFPCFRLQDKLQKGTLGEKHWLRLAKRYYKILVLEQYKAKHNGAEPAISSFDKFKRLFGIGVVSVYQV